MAIKKRVKYKIRISADGKGRGPAGVVPIMPAEKTPFPEKLKRANEIIDQLPLETLEKILRRKPPF